MLGVARPFWGGVLRGRENRFFTRRAPSRQTATSTDDLRPAPPEDVRHRRLFLGRVGRGVPEPRIWNPFAPEQLRNRCDDGHNILTQIPRIPRIRGRRGRLNSTAWRIPSTTVWGARECLSA